MRRISASGMIVGVATAVPHRRITNESWTDAACAEKVTGVQERRQVNKHLQTQTDLAVAAARNLLASIDWAPESIDYVVYVTQTPSRSIPAPGFDFHFAMGLLDDCLVMPLNWSCAGFVEGLMLAYILAERSLDSRILLIAGDITSTVCDPHDRATAPLFGDAVSATAVTRGDASTIFHVGNSGRGNDALSQPNGGSLAMDGSRVFDFTLKQVAPLVAAVLADSPMPPDFALFHQANTFMLKHLVKKCRFDPTTVVPSNIRTWGNTSSASIPLLICDCIDPPKPGGRQVAAMFGFGAGWAWAGASVNIADCRHRQVITVHA